MTIKEAHLQILATLQPLYDTREAQNITHWVLEHITGLSKIDRIVQHHHTLSEQQQQQLKKILSALATGMPAQYALNEAWFYGEKLYVDQHVLIPRVETEELIEWVIQDTRTRTGLQIVDIGSGSGCIPLLLKKHLPQHRVTGIDISENALRVAERNQRQLQVEVTLLQRNFLQWDIYDWPPVDILVSNPPYIPAGEAGSMDKRVTDFEPGIALFVKDDRPLIFYEALSAFGKRYLQKGGAIYMEIHESLGAATAALFKNEGWGEVIVKKDMQGKDRMIKVIP